jgi:hypothetical protein
MHETYGSVEMYTIYNLLFLIFYIPMPLPISYISLHLLKISQRFTLFDSPLQLIDPMTTADMY